MGHPRIKALYPTEGQIVRALINAIANHRDVANADVYYPYVTGDRNIVRKVPLASYRTFAGTEYIEDGLTLSVYLPGTNQGLGRAITYENHHLGNASMQEWSVKATVRLVVHLYYREASYNAPTIIYSEQSSPINDIVNALPHGRMLQYKEGFDQPVDLPGDTLQEHLPETHFVGQKMLQVNILPGEEILRNWMAILRGVIRDINVLKPFTVRNPTIQSVNYETPNWEGKDKMNLVFHSAFMVVTYDLYEPPRAQDYILPKPNFVLQSGNPEIDDVRSFVS
jgi:hypothetical protein